MSFALCISLCIRKFKGAVLIVYNSIHANLLQLSLFPYFIPPQSPPPLLLPRLTPRSINKFSKQGSGPVPPPHGPGRASPLAHGILQFLPGSKFPSPRGLQASSSAVAPTHPPALLLASSPAGFRFIYIFHLLCIKFEWLFQCEFCACIVPFILPNQSTLETIV